MPNAFLSPEVIAAVGLERLRRELILPRLVTRMGLADFRGAKDDTVNIRVPAILHAREYEWRTRTNPIVVDEITELSIPVQMNRHIYSAVQVTDEELTLDIRDFLAQILDPQVIAVAEKLEGMISAVMQSANYVTGEDVDYVQGSADDAFYRALVDVRKILNDREIPQSGRVVAIGSGLEASALKEEAIRAADQSGSTDALRGATLGNVAGFTVISTNSLPEDFGVAFHRSAFVFANAAPEVPAGASFGQSATDSGLAMRWLRDYDPNYLRDRSVVSSFAGSASVEDGRDPDSGDSGQTPSGALNQTNIRAVKINFTASS